MKEAIKGYITALINTYDKKTVPGLPLGMRQCASGFLGDLNDLMDYVEDIPAAIENEVLKNRILMLEETCESFVEVEENLHKQINRLKRYNRLFIDAERMLIAENEKLRRKIEMMEGENNG